MKTLSQGLDVEDLRAWGLPLHRSGKLLIAGPCAAESQDQVLKTARGLTGLGIGLFRAGIWKPRTHPGSFEGAGEAGFAWLEQARRETGLKFAVEVANAEHVYRALEHGADALWLGARTTVTPFAVQEIADALEGIDVPVLVKNPVNPDLETWIGALERLRNGGVRRLGAVWRGVTDPQASPFRNAPMWSMPLGLRRRLPQVPCLCDPSHIGGRRDFVRPLCQQALDLAFAGLMIESHCSPEQALSDSAQQLCPEALGALLGELRWARSEEESGQASAQLSDRRLELDQVDASLLELLSKRMRLSRELGELKRSERLAVLQSGRWERVLQQALTEGQALGLEENFVRDLFERIHLESLRTQL